MPTDDDSAEHHWWPVALQKLWSNKDDAVSYLVADGSTGSKKYKNRQMGMKRRAHHVNLGNSPWTHTFEKELFDQIDNTISQIVPQTIQSHPPFGSRLRDWPSIVYKHFNRSLSFKDFVNFSSIDSESERRLLLLAVSLLVRSPAFRFRRMAFPISLGLPPDENIGSISVEHYMRAAVRQIAVKAPLGFWIFFKSLKKEFCYGDGMLDTLSDTLQGPNIIGKFLLPLTPRVCIFYFTTNFRKTNLNIASTYIGDENVEHINNITKIYSKSRVFFRQTRPPFDEYIASNSHLTIAGHNDTFLEKYETYVREEHCVPLISR